MGKMMIGVNNITKMFLGTINVKKVFYGNSLLYSSRDDWGTGSRIASSDVEYMVPSVFYDDYEDTNYIMFDQYQAGTASYYFHLRENISDTDWQRYDYVNHLLDEGSNFLASEADIIFNGYGGTQIMFSRVVVSGDVYFNVWWR